VRRRFRSPLHTSIIGTEKGNPIMSDQTLSADQMSANARIQEVAKILSAVVLRELASPSDACAESNNVPSNLSKE